eukprot:122568-Prorocentrum_minimum.AAC.1
MLPEFARMHRMMHVRVRVLHVVRDGRDMAWDEDNSDVEHFENNLWPRKHAAKEVDQDKNVRAMHVWSALNRQTSECAKKLQVRDRIK